MRSFRQRLRDQRVSRNIEDRRIPSGIAPQDSAGYPVTGDPPNLNQPVYIEPGLNEDITDAASVDTARYDLERARQAVVNRGTVKGRFRSVGSRKK